MNAHITFIAVISLIGVCLTGCAGNTTQQKVEKYPHKPAVSDERKSGPAMFFYEAAENDADPNEVIVIPPDDKKQKEDTP